MAAGSAGAIRRTDVGGDNDDIAFGCADAQSGFHLETVEFVARDGLRCDGYVVWENEPITDIVLSMGGSGAGTSAFLPDPAAGMVLSRTAAFITFDKPGVHATFGEPSSVHIDDAPFAAHTQGTLLDCAEAALLFSLSRFGPRSAGISAGTRRGPPSSSFSWTGSAAGGRRMRDGWTC